MSVFVPNPKLSSQTNPRDWAYEIGCLPQNASIVFTKASLVSFLKTHNIEVGPNNAELSKLPRYASFGTMKEEEKQQQQQQQQQQPSKPADIMTNAIDESTSQVQTLRHSDYEAPRAAPAPVPTSNVGDAVPAPATAKAPAQDVRTPDGEAFRPTRRVREPIGGGSAQIGALFGGADEEYDEAVKEAERERAKRRGLPIDGESQVTQAPQLKAIDNNAQQRPSVEADVDQKAAGGFRPTRRVREPGGTGGQSSIAIG